MSSKKTGLAVIILAAGKGSRMKSDLPKALHTLCGKPMLWFLLETVKKLSPQKTLVVAGHKINLVRPLIPDKAVIVEQKQLLGSGHAVMQAKKVLSGFKGTLLVLYCDTPFLSLEILQMLIAKKDDGADGVLLSVNLEDPSEYGRIKRSPGGHFEKIIENNDATIEEKAIKEINVGCYAFDSQKLFKALRQIKKNPIKKEYFLTDAVETLAKDGKVECVVTDNQEETFGVNTRRDLAKLEESAQRNILNHWLDEGVSIRDPKTTTIDAGVKIGKDTVIYPHTVIEEDSVIGKNCKIGPFARVRGASSVGDECIVGNFVELVRSKVGSGTYIKHLSYVGDAQVGSSVNIGAGTITANYDGKNKHKTVIKDRAHLGSGTVLIAPVVVGRGAKTGAGAVVTKKTNIPDGCVFVGVPARNIEKGQESHKS